MKNYNGLLIGSSFAASVFVFGITSGLISVKNASIGSLVGLPAALISHVVTDSKAQKRIREADSKLSKALRELDIANSKASNFELCEAMRSDLLLELEKTRKALDLAVEAHKTTCNVNQGMKQESIALQTQLATFKSDIEQLQLEIEEWEDQFSDRVELAADAKFQIAKKAEIQKIFAEHDAITSQAMQMFQELQQWGQKVAHGHQVKREIIKEMASNYNQNLDEFADAARTEISGYVNQIELLNEKTARLQQKLNGDLVEPEYLPVAYSVEGRIANDLAKLVFSDLQLPLAVKGFYTKPDGSTDVGYGYSRSIPPEAVVEAVKRHSEHLARRLGIHRITAVRKLEIADLIVLTFRREPAVKASDIGLYVGSADEFVNYITSHPVRFRLIADPGMGKSPTAAVMLSEILKVGTRRVTRLRVSRLLTRWSR
jgi:hypothetical protein